MDSPTLNANALRGQYSSKSKLEESNQSHELETETAMSTRKPNQENLERKSVGKKPQEIDKCTHQCNLMDPIFCEASYSDFQNKYM